MSVILAMDPGYLCTRIGIFSGGSRMIREVTALDPFTVGESMGGTPSVVVLPGGPPARLYPWHPRNVAATKASAYCAARGIPCVVVRDAPDSQASLPPKARLSGFPGHDRRPTFYEIPESDAFAEAARMAGLSQAEARIIVVYLGDEVSVSARAGGQVVDSSDPAACEGPFGFRSCGTLPATSFLSYVATQGHSMEELRRLMKEGSGTFAYAGVDSMHDLARALDEGEPEATGAIAAMAYQISKEIGRQVAVLGGKLDLIALCGPGVHLLPLVAAVEDRVGKWAGVSRLTEDLVMTRLFVEGTKVASQK